jgi:hypothetical protein
MKMVLVLLIIFVLEEKNVDCRRLQSLITPPFQTQLEKKLAFVSKAHATTSKFHSLFLLNDVDSPQFTFLRHSLEKKMESEL